MALFVKTGAKYAWPETTFGPELFLYYDSIHSDFHHVEYRRYELLFGPKSRYQKLFEWSETPENASLFQTS